MVNFSIPLRLSVPESSLTVLHPQIRYCKVPALPSHFYIWVMPADHHIHRITEWLLWTSCSSIPYSAINRLPRTVSGWAFNFSKDGESTISLGNLSHCLTTFTIKMFFCCIQMEFSVFILCPLSLATTGKSLVPCSLHPFFRYLHTLVISRLRILFSRLNSPRSLSFSS